jgi:multiple antibiotic resistance protein
MSFRHGAGLLAPWAILLTTPAAAAASGNSSPDLSGVALDLGRVFTFFFLTLGPKQVLVPFARVTRAMDVRKRLTLALGTAVLSLFSVFIAATLGVRILGNWGISPAALLITAGIMLFLVAIDSIREQYTGEDGQEIDAAGISRARLLFRLAFPYVVSPYGVAVVILTMTLRPADADVWPIIAILAALMTLNFVIMMLAGRILATDIIAPLLAIVGSILAVLQAALGVHMLLVGLRLAGLGVA